MLVLATIYDDNHYQFTIIIAKLVPLLSLGWSILWKCLEETDASHDRPNR